MTKESTGIEIAALRIPGEKEKIMFKMDGAPFMFSTDFDIFPETKVDNVVAQTVIQFKNLDLFKDEQGGPSASLQGLVNRLKRLFMKGTTLLLIIRSNKFLEDDKLVDRTFYAFKLSVREKGWVGLMKDLELLTPEDLINSIEKLPAARPPQQQNMEPA